MVTTPRVAVVVLHVSTFILHQLLQSNNECPGRPAELSVKTGLRGLPRIMAPSLPDALSELFNFPVPRFLHL